MEELDLREIIKVFFEKKVLIIVVTLLCILVGGTYSYFIMTPKYESSTTIVLTKTDTTTLTEYGVSTDSITQTDVTLNQKLVSTYSEIIKSSTILRQVITNLESLNLTEDELKKNVTVTAVEDTEVIKISVVNENPEYAAKIANEISKVFAEKVTEMYKINNVYTLDTAEVPNSPYNINHIKYIIISTIIGIILSCGYVLILYLLNNTTKNKEDIEKNISIPVLVSLGKFEGRKRKGARA